MPIDHHPLYDTADCSAGQSGPVWFLGGTFTTIEQSPGVVVGIANRTCTVPADKALFFPIGLFVGLNHLFSFAVGLAAGGFVVSLALQFPVPLQYQAWPALSRIEENSYGQCVDCGHEIPEGRLDARPEAARCVGCQSKWAKRHR